MDDRHLTDRQKIERVQSNARALIVKLKARLKIVPTVREEEVLQFIRRARKVTKCDPSQAAIAKHFQFSRERARQLVGRLVDKGYLEARK